MKVMVVGGGGREHAIVKKLRENASISELYVLPGNGGIARDATCVAISATDIDGIVDFAAKNKIDFAVVAPDDPLVMGAVDRLNEIGVRCFGPTARAAIIEGSKVFSKNLMKKYGIPTAAYETFSDEKSASEYLGTAKYPIVIKADGLALGKGVVIAETREEALAAVEEIMTDKIFGKSGNNIVIEEFLQGPEVTVLAFTDGKTIVPMVSSMDHKRVGDGNVGPNTGGMGTIAPNPYYDDVAKRECMDKIFLPTVRAMNAEGRTFKGCLYFGLMLTDDGPKVIEYNCRFGDPEAQVVLSLLKSDLFSIMQAVEAERLGETEVVFDDKYACCVVAASGGYPKAYEKGFPIDFGDVSKMKNITVYHAGTAEKDGRIVTNGGRVLGVTAVENSLNFAIDLAYSAIGQIKFDKMYYRRDIGRAYRR